MIKRLRSILKNNPCNLIHPNIFVSCFDAGHKLYAGRLRYSPIVMLLPAGLVSINWSPVLSLADLCWRHRSTRSHLTQPGRGCTDQ